MEVPLDRALVTTSILDNLQVNVRQIIFDQIIQMAQGRDKSLAYRCLISNLCNEARMFVLPINEGKKLANELYSLKKRCGSKGVGARKRDRLMF